MAMQTIFQAGNSTVVAIPKELSKEMNLKVGQKVEVRQVHDNAMLVTIHRSTSPKKTPLDSEFATWLNQFLKEDKDLLDNLASR